MTDDQMDELTQIGYSFVAMASTANRLGHSSPAESLRYMLNGDMFAKDFVHWCSRKPGYDAARLRIREYFDVMGFEELVAARTEESMRAKGLSLAELLPTKGTQ
jgi:hypothetical protein